MSHLEAHIRAPHEIVLEAMLEGLPPVVENEDAALIYALRWQGFTLGEIERHLDEIKRRRAA